MNVDMHVSKTEPIEVTGEYYASDFPGEDFAILRIATNGGSDTVKIYMHNLAEIEAIAFHANSLARELRDAQGWADALPEVTFEEMERAQSGEAESAWADPDAQREYNL